LTLHFAFGQGKIFDKIWKFNKKRSLPFTFGQGKKMIRIWKNQLSNNQIKRGSHNWPWGKIGESLKNSIFLLFL
jgi:hypothetical protein